MGLTTTTTNLSYARNELTRVGVSFTFDKVADMIYYFVKNCDVATTYGSRTSGSGLDLGTYEAGLSVAAQYTDSATLTNTTDYVGCAGIFDLKLGRAITLASGGGYGFATVWANLEVDKAINSTGGQSAGWFTIWADATGGDAAITGSSRLQVMDLAIVTGSAFNAGASTKIYGLRIDSSANASATMDGEFAAINIEAAGTKKDWTIGIDVNNCATGMDIGAGCTANGLVINEADLVVGSRTSGSGVDLGTFETGCLVAAQYTDAAALANTTDYVGCAGIFDLKLGRAITLASGGGYGMATIWANLEVDKAINSTGGQSAAWMTIWADATSTDAQIRGTSRLQVLDLAIVTGADFDASGSTKIYGLRIDSSANTSATVDGEFAAINIEAAGTKKDWTIGIDVNDCTTGIDVAVTATATGKNGIYVHDTFTATGATVHKAIQGDVTYSATGRGTPIGVAGKVMLTGDFTGGAGYCWGVQGQMNFSDGCTMNDASSVFAGGRFVLTEDSKDGWTHTTGHLCVVLIDSLLQTSVTTTNCEKSLLRIGNWGGSSNFCTFDSVFHVYGRYCDHLFYFFDCDAADSFITAETSDPSGEQTHKIKVYLNNGSLTRYLILYTDPS